MLIGYGCSDENSSSMLMSEGVNMREVVLDGGLVVDGLVVDVFFLVLFLLLLFLVFLLVVVIFLFPTPFALVLIDII